MLGSRASDNSLQIQPVRHSLKMDLPQPLQLIMQSTDSKYLDEYRIIKTLGQGYHAKVKLAEGPDHKLVAIKKFKPETANMDTLKHQLNVLQQLHHENLVNLIAVRPNSVYKKRDGSTYPCFAIILQYVGGGELFDFVALGGKFSTNVTRTYFYQLMNAVNYMHEKGFAHRDIKPQNILLDQKYTLKLADFGFTTLFAGKDKSGVLHTKLGTEGYMAPEIQTKNYDGRKADIFSCGVILFIMYTASPPFERSIPSDPYYKLLKDKNYAAFWGFHGKRRPAGFFSDDFKDLVVKMLAYDVKQRPTMIEISQHPWTKGPVLSSDSLKSEFDERKRKVDEEMNSQREQQRLKKEARDNALYNRETASRSDNEDVQVFMDNYENAAGKSHHLPLVKESRGYLIREEEEYFFSSLMTFLANPIFLSFEDYLIKFDPKYQITGNKVSVKFSYKDLEEEHDVGVQITVSRTSDKNLSLEFNQTSGQELYFRRIVLAIKGQFINAAINA